MDDSIGADRASGGASARGAARVAHGDASGALEAFRGLRCLVTGGAGFIGSNLCRRLLALEARVVVLDNLATGRRDNLPGSPGMTVVQADLRWTSRLPDLVADSDVVFHLAAQVGNVKSIAETVADAESNIVGTVRLLRACRDSAVRKVVYASSSAIFGEADRIPIAESHPQRPASFYALSKATAERYALLAQSVWGVPAVGLRYFNVFGLPMEASEYTGVISIFFHRLLAGAPLTIYGTGEQIRDFVFVDDIVQANLLAALHGQPGRVYNVGSGARTSVVELAAAMCEVAGRTPGVHFAPSRAGEVARSVADISRAHHELGYAPSWSLRRGLGSMWDRLVAQ